MSVVGLIFARPRILGIPVLVSIQFEQVNFRFDVRCRNRRCYHQDAVFIKEIVSNRLVALAVNHMYGENYLTLPMAHKVYSSQGGHDDGSIIEYTWRYQSRLNKIQIESKGNGVFPTTDSEADFLAERYWGYAAQSDGSCVAYRVEHLPWRIRRAAVTEF